LAAKKVGDKKNVNKDKNAQQKAQDKAAQKTQKKAAPKKKWLTLFNLYDIIIWIND